MDVVWEYKGKGKALEKDSSSSNSSSGGGEAVPGKVYRRSRSVAIQTVRFKTVGTQTDEADFDAAEPLSDSLIVEFSKKDDEEEEDDDYDSLF